MTWIYNCNYALPIACFVPHHFLNEELLLYLASSVVYLSVLLTIGTNSVHAV